MKLSTALIAFLILLLLSACDTEPICPTGSVTYADDPSQFPIPTIDTNQDPSSTPSLIAIAGKMIEVDRVIEGPLCNDRWSGTVYVKCNIQVVDWSEEKNPLFLESCNLAIEPDTVVYVAAHNDAPYYNGCSCHTGGGPENP
jgi:hypothetical protein